VISVTRKYFQYKIAARSAFKQSVNNDEFVDKVVCVSWPHSCSLWYVDILYTNILLCTSYSCNLKTSSFAVSNCLKDGYISSSTANQQHF